MFGGVLFLIVSKYSSTTITGALFGGLAPSSDGATEAAYLTAAQESAQHFLKHTAAAGSAVGNCKGLSFWKHFSPVGTRYQHAHTYVIQHGTETNCDGPYTPAVLPKVHKDNGKDLSKKDEEEEEQQETWQALSTREFQKMLETGVTVWSFQIYLLTICVVSAILKSRQSQSLRIFQTYFSGQGHTWLDVLLR